ncbi:zinc ribbon domain-containing protein [Clostridium sp. SYSU_GA19001]|nr:zinc ribbon domain-containing protein [Clostridium caldaquaticum]
MNDVFYCPDCSSKLEVISGCGSTSYFCNKCKKLISKTKIVPHEQLVTKIDEKAVKKLSSE